MDQDKMAEDLEALKTENIELKISDVRKDVASLKTDLHQHLDRILEQTSKTNGSVARALERIYTLERQDSKARLDEIYKELEKHKEQTRFWTTLYQNKWIAGLMAISLYAMSIAEIREAIIQLLRLG